MTSMTPIEIERGILELIADPNRAKALLDTIRQAEAAEGRARVAQAEADKAMKLAADTLAQAREVQGINAAKSARLQQDAEALAQAGEDMKAAKADTEARLAEWEGRLKDREARLSEMEAACDRRVTELDARDDAMDAREAAAAETIARAERINAAMG